MTDNINITSSPTIVIEPSFSWYPAGTNVYTSPGGITFVSPSATYGQLLTFTAALTITDPLGTLSVVEYRWDFGDDVIGYGNPVTHTYSNNNIQATAKLRITDSNGRYWFTQRQVYIASVVGLPGTASPLLMYPYP